MGKETKSTACPTNVKAGESVSDGNLYIFCFLVGKFFTVVAYIELICIQSLFEVAGYKYLYFLKIAYLYTFIVE